MRWFQAAGSHEIDGGVQYHAMRRFQAAGSHEIDGGVQYHAMRRFQAAGSTLSEPGGSPTDRGTVASVPLPSPTDSPSLQHIVEEATAAAIAAVDHHLP